MGSRTTYDVINLQHTKPFVQGRVRMGGTDPEAKRADLRNSSLVLFEVGRRKLDPDLKAPPGCQSLILKKDNNRY